MKKNIQWMMMIWLSPLGDLQNLLPMVCSGPTTLPSASIRKNDPKGLLIVRQRRAEH
jgi:hypothetical protein